MLIGHKLTMWNGLYVRGAASGSTLGFGKLTAPIALSGQQTKSNTVVKCAFRIAGISMMKITRCWAAYCLCQGNGLAVTPIVSILGIYLVMN